MKQYSGYMTINGSPANGTNLFYWSFEVSGVFAKIEHCSSSDLLAVEKQPRYGSFRAVVDRYSALPAPHKSQFLTIFRRTRLQLDVGSVHGTSSRWSLRRDLAEITARWREDGPIRCRRTAPTR